MIAAAVSATPIKEYMLYKKFSCKSFLPFFDTYFTIDSVLAY